MKLLLNYIIVLFYLTLAFSCSDKTDSRLVYYKLHPDSFIDDLVAEGTVESVNSSIVNCPQRLSGTIIFLVEDASMVKKGDTVCILENREYASFYEDLLTRVEQSRAQYNKSKADLDMSYSLLQAQVKSNEAQSAITNLDSVQLQYLSIQQRRIKMLELEIAAIEKSKYETKLKFLDQINESELRKLELQIKQDENQAARIKEILDGMIMTAPRDGLALRAKMRQGGAKVQEGDNVWGGIPLVEIPDLSEVKVMIMASETNYKRISENNEVAFSFDAMPGNMAWGKIEKKAPMGQPVSRNSKVRIFEITAKVDSFKVLPEVGVSASCRVFLSYIPDTIVVPQLAIFDDDSLKVVYVKTSWNSYEKRQVLISKSSPGSAVIAAGLSGDEVVSFIKPKPAKIKSTLLLPDSLQVLNKANNNNNGHPVDEIILHEDDGEPDIIL